MANTNQTPRPEDLFDPVQLNSELRQLIGPGLAGVKGAAAAGDKVRLHREERLWADAVVAALDIDLAVSGLDHIDAGRQYVVAPLHEGFADVLALLRLPLDLEWVIRDELLDLPYFGEYLRLAGHIAVEPEFPRAALRTILSEVPAAIDRGESVVIFPQGSLLGIEIAFQAGAFQLADRFGLPLLPVVLTGSHRVWDYPFTRSIRGGQSIRAEVLDPIAVGDAVKAMAGVEAEMKRRARAVTEAPVRHYVPDRDGLWEGYRFELDDA